MCVRVGVWYENAYDAAVYYYKKNDKEGVKKDSISTENPECSQNREKYAFQEREQDTCEKTSRNVCMVKRNRNRMRE